MYSPHLREKSFNTSAALSSCATSFLILLCNVLSPWLVTCFRTSDMKLKFLDILERFVPSLCCLAFLIHLGVEFVSPTSQVLSSLSLLGDVYTQHKPQRVSCCCDASSQLNSCSGTFLGICQPVFKPALILIFTLMLSDP